MLVKGAPSACVSCVCVSVGPYINSEPACKKTNHLYNGDFFYLSPIVYYQKNSQKQKPFARKLAQ